MKKLAIQILFLIYLMLSIGCQSLDETATPTATTAYPETPNNDKAWPPVLVALETDGSQNLYQVFENGIMNRLTDTSANKTNATWNWDHSQIAYTECMDDQCTVIILDPISSHSERITDPSLGVIVSLAWSHTGKHIAYSGIDLKISNYPNAFVYSVENGQTTLLDKAPSDLGVYVNAWSFDDQEVFVSAHLDENLLLWRTYGINFAENRLFPLDFGGVEHQLGEAWNPTEALLAFIGRPGKGEHSYFGNEGQIYVMEAGTKELTPVTKSETIKSGLQWSPNGKYLAFVEEDKDRLRLMVIDRSGNLVQTFQINAQYIQRLAWSPDSQKIAIIWTEIDTAVLGVSDISNGEVRTILENVDFMILSW